jgi:hypothetical protein
MALIKSGTWQFMFAFQFSMIHIAQFRKMLSAVMAHRHPSAELTSLLFAVWERNPGFSLRAAMPPRDSLVRPA